jgi:magnesium transporter
MEIKHNRHVKWIDITKPTEKDLAWLKEEFSLHPVIIDELREPSTRARVERYKDYLYFIYYFPLYDTKYESSVRSEIDFVVTKNTIVTVHYEPLDEPLKGMEIHDEKGSVELLYRLVEHLIIFEERQLRHIREKVEKIGEDIFNGKEKELLERITYLKRDISEYRISVKMPEPILRSLLVKGSDFWGKGSEVYINDLIGEQLKLANQIQDYRETISDFEDANDQLMNQKLNSVMKTFTLLSFLTLPFVLVAALFSMRVQGTPFTDVPGGFWIVLGIMVVGMAMMFAVFKKRKWF